jgi:hypothetical protein
MPGQVGRTHQRRRENAGLPKGLAVYPLTSKTSMSYRPAMYAFRPPMYA